MSISFELRWFCSFSERDCKAAVSFNESETAISFRATTFFDCFKRVIEMEGLTVLSCMESNTSTCVHSHSVSPDHSFRHSESMTTCKSRSIECTRFSRAHRLSDETYDKPKQKPEKQYTKYKETFSRYTSFLHTINCQQSRPLGQIKTRSSFFSQYRTKRIVKRDLGTSPQIARQHIGQIVVHLCSCR